MARRSSKVASGVAPAPPGLELHAVVARAQVLLRERARLLREVQKKKRQLEQFRQQISRAAEEAVTKVAPLVERQRVLVTELSALFDELLAEGRLAARARKQIAKLRRALELQGLLSPLGDDDDELEDDDDVSGFWDDSEPRARPADPRRSQDPSRPEVASAQQLGQERRSLRDIFRSLARAVHPDQARHEGERTRRTEVMKEVTRAYEDGDLARLIELESAWESQQVLAEAGASEARCGELERVNRELLDQLRQLTRELRDVKRGARAAFFGELSTDEMVEQAGRELDDFDGICEFVRKFRDGKITLAELLRGPPRARRQEDEDFAVLERLLLEQLENFEPAPRARRKQPRR